MLLGFLYALKRAIEIFIGQDQFFLFAIMILCQREYLSTPAQPDHLATLLNPLHPPPLHANVAMLPDYFYRSSMDQRKKIA